VTSASRCDAASTRASASCTPTYAARTRARVLGARHLLAQLRRVQRLTDDLATRRALGADLERLLEVAEELDPFQILRPGWLSRRGPAPPAITGLDGNSCDAPTSRAATACRSARARRISGLDSSARASAASSVSTSFPGGAAPSARAADTAAETIKHEMKTDLAGRNIEVSLS
jgi:hypothetical protein